MPIHAAFVGAVIAAALCVRPMPVAHADKAAPIPGLGATCAACHPEPASEWARTLHRRTVGASQIAEDRQGCAACHKGAAEHLADPTVETNRPSLSGLDADQTADMCLSCHKGGSQMLWDLSSHQSLEQACLSCHDPHGGYGTAMLKAPEPELCEGCHATQVAEGSLPSHHPIAEGKMVCSDCHNVHGEQRGALAEASTPEMCYKCHGEKAGPFMFEHPPVTEDCATCHKPHGSQNDHLLVQDQPLLCLQCHAGHSDGHLSPLVAGDTPENAELATHAFYDRCTSCHSRIHGTDLPSGSDNGTFMPGRPLDEPEVAASHSAFSAASVDSSLWGFSGIELGRFEAEDNPNYVREYAGREYDVPAFDLDITKFSDDYDYRLQMKGLGRGDQDLGLRFGNSIYDVQVNQSGLTHRIARFNDPVDGAGIVPIAGNSVEAEDRANGKDDYHLDRTTFELKLAARHPNFSQVKWVANAWREAETGSQQFLFLERCVNCHKVQVSEPIDRTTTITQVG
ncbi:MAG: DmsE family decaheme c-type cytochrome, partial [Armatimonadetes bacterium]|nr:DmsE family decaheme c-type cytochrome [Armatimonadota bacterium]